MSRTQSIRTMICMALVVLSGLIQGADAAVLEWKTATPDGDWETPSNWTVGAKPSSSVPGRDDIVLIRGRSVVIHMPCITKRVDEIKYLGMNWNKDTEATASLTLDGPMAFLKVRGGTYLNRSTAGHNSNTDAAINILNGAVFQTTALRMSTQAVNRVSIHIGADSELRVWHPMASTADIVDWGNGDHVMHFEGPGASFSMTGPGDQTDVIRQWMDRGLLVRNTETTGDLNITYDPQKKLTTVVASPKITAE
ncbi:MAG: hypothetical protein AB7E95_00420 [Kiritimatiellales bacterium]